MAVTRIMGIDYGRRRIGLAIAELETRIAVPLATLEGRNDASRDARLVLDAAQGEGATLLVVGLPLNMDGSDSEQTALTRGFSAELERLGSIPVCLHDERLTSHAAHEALDAAGIRSRDRRGLTDRIAAQKILQSYLDEASAQ